MDHLYDKAPQAQPLKQYLTVAGESCIEVIIQKSRFIGCCFPVAEEQAALCKLAGIKKLEWNANHNCYAYSIGADGGIARYSDDGEPGGTAGLPIMEVIRNKGVTNVLCVVTRYFGGILLGAGGLVRAYSRAASEAVSAASPICMKPCAVYAVEMDYSRWAGMETLLRQYGEVVDIRYAEDISLEITAPDCGEAFERMMAERSDGRVVPKKIGQRYSAFPIKQI